MFQQIDDGADRGGEHHQIAARGSLHRAAVARVDSAAPGCYFEHLRTVATDQASPEPRRAQGQPEGAADQADADNRNLSKRHPVYSSSSVSSPRSALAAAMIFSCCWAGTMS